MEALFAGVVYLHFSNTFLELSIALLTTSKSPNVTLDTTSPIAGL